MDAAAPPARRNRSPESWAAARADYLAGLSAAGVCARHDLGLSALRARARREGWRRLDQTGPEPADPHALDPDLIEDLDEELEAQRPPDLTAMTERASRLADRALGLGAWPKLRAGCGCGVSCPSLWTPSRTPPTAAAAGRRPTWPRACAPSAAPLAPARS